MDLASSEVVKEIYDRIASSMENLIASLLQHFSDRDSSSVRKSNPSSFSAPACSRTSPNWF